MNREMTLDQITIQALRLPPLQKVQLVERLMVTLEQELVEPRPQPEAGEQAKGVQPATESLFKRRLVEVGLLRERRSSRQRPSRRHKPLHITGKPLSEIVIEERR